jgi:hypothetical protein
MQSIPPRIVTSSHCEQNEEPQPKKDRIKRAYFAFLKEAKGLSEASIGAAANAIARFEAYTCWRRRPGRARHFGGGYLPSSRLKDPFRAILPGGRVDRSRDTAPAYRRSVCDKFAR